MVPDIRKKNIRIPVKILGNSIHYFNGGPLPELMDGIYGNLIVPEHGILDKIFTKRLKEEHEILFVNRKTTLLAIVNPKEIEKEDWNYLKKIRACDSLGYFIEIVLEDDLFIRLHRTKKTNLLPCKCNIPSFGSQGGRAASLNHAYRLISERFEPTRLSHSGNVFKHVFYQEKGVWYPLEKMRKEIEAKTEEIIKSGEIEQIELFPRGAPLKKKR